ncbi:MAG: FlgD immunoglobulin-like domain containing protein [Bacteroidota bacterium]
MKNTLPSAAATFAFFALITCTANLFAQPGARIFPPEEYSETPSDPYIHVPREGQATSPAFHFTSSQFSIHQVNVNDAGLNILGDAANEPSIAIDPNNPLRMAIGWRQFDTIASNFRQAGYGYTLDGGENWTFPGVIQPGIFRSDPVLDFDLDGNFFYNSLTVTDNYYCDVFKTAGTELDEGIPAFGGDKQWMAVDRTGGAGSGNVYAFWKPGISSCPEGWFTRSLDNGASFEECIEEPGYGTRGTLAVSPEGELYACGGVGGGFMVSKSSNAGVAGEELVWDFSVPVDLGGDLALYAGPNPTGMLGQAWIQVDHSGGEHHGDIYLLASVVNFSNGDPADVMFAKSTDGGLTWSEPVRINTDESEENWQWFGTMSVAPNGRIDVVWLDTRDDPGGYDSKLFYSFSLDGGSTWSENEALSEAFDPHLGFPQQQKIGDYYHSISDNEGAHLAWAATFNGEEDIFYSFIKPALPSAVGDKKVASVAALRTAPNPFRERTRIEYSIENTTRVRLEIVDLHGRVVLVLEDGEKSAGSHSASWDGSDASGEKVPGGVYACKWAVDEMGAYSCRIVFLR